MKRMINIGFLMCLLCFATSNCVENFNAHLPVSDIGLLIVEGNKYFG